MKMKTEIKILTLIAVLSAFFAGASQANIVLAESKNSLPTFYVYAYDAELEPVVNNDWDFIPVISDEKASISIEFIIPGTEIESVNTPAVTMALVSEKIN